MTLLLKVGDTVNHVYTNKIYTITDVFEGFYQAKIFHAAINEKIKFYISKNKKIHIDALDKNWMQVELPKNKFNLNDKVYFEKDVKQGQVNGTIIAYVAEISRAFGKPHYYYYIESEVNKHIVLEYKIFKIINTNNIWNNLCQNSNLTK